MRQWVLALACALAASPTAASVSGESHHPTQLQKVVDIDEGVVHMAVSGVVAATPEQVWSLLTEYGSLPAYMPGVDSSLVVSSSDTSCVVRQVVTTRIVLPWTFRMDLEFVPDLGSQRLRFRQVRGSLRGYEGQWEIAPGRTGSTLLRYEARARLRRPIPGFVAAHIVRGQMEKMLAALVGELARRARTDGSTEGSAGRELR